MNNTPLFKVDALHGGRTGTSWFSSRMTGVGMIREVSDSHFKWEIPFNHFRSLSYTILSPGFQFLGHTWFLNSKLLTLCNDKILFFQLQSSRDFVSNQSTLAYRMRIQAKEEHNYWVSPLVMEEFSNEKYKGTVQRCKKPNFMADEHSLSSGGYLSLHLMFDMQATVLMPTRQAAGNLTVLPVLQPVPSSSHTATDIVSNASSNLQPTPCFSSHSFAGSSVILRNFAMLLYSGKHSDVTFMVKGREFKAHKAILTAQSPVLDRMFDKVGEEIRGSVEITDCEPDNFQAYLLYMYTGRVDISTVKRALALFNLANTYNVEGLVPHCVRYLIRNLTLDTFYDIVSVGLRHCNTELMSAIIQFFDQNVQLILFTDRWIAFRNENPTEADEIMINTGRM